MLCVVEVFRFHALADATVVSLLFLVLISKMSENVFYFKLISKLNSFCEEL